MLLRAALPLVLLAAASLASVPQAAAHCDLGPQHTLSVLLGNVTRTLDSGVQDLVGADPGLEHACLVNTPIEAAVDAVNDALGGRAAVVLIMYEQFHPEVVRVQSGGTVVFWAPDPQEWTPTIAHSVTSTGPCRDASLDPSIDASLCRPIVADPQRDRTGPYTGQCFDSEADMGGPMPGFGPEFGGYGDAPAGSASFASIPQQRYAYPLSLAYGRSGDLVEKRFGPQTGVDLVDAATGSAPLGNVTHWDDGFRPCPAPSSQRSEGSAVVPYYCKYHGVNEFVRVAGGIEYRYGWMRGAIVVDA